MLSFNEMFLVCFFTDKGVILKVHMVVCLQTQEDSLQ